MSYFSELGISGVSEEEANRLFPQTVPNGDGQYLVGLYVFHELHCLVSVAISTRPNGLMLKFDIEHAKEDVKLRLLSGSCQRRDRWDGTKSA